MTGALGPVPPVELASELVGRVLAGAVAASPVHVGPRSSELERETEELAQELRARMGRRLPSQIDELAPARELYRAFGVDPTKTRPSSESLLRRVLRGQSLPLILNAVDLGNLMALRFMLPIGLYDAARIDGPVTVRSGLAGESYSGIRKNEIHLEGRLVVADRHGPFGNPSADSLRTRVEVSTRALWMVLFAPASYSAERLENHLASASAALERHLEGPLGPVRTTAALISPRAQ